MPTLRPIISALALLLLTFSTAQAATLNVPSTQYPTIQAGINAAQPGDTVLVADGTYTGPGNVDIDFNGKNITVTSVHGAASTIIDCQASSSNAHRGFYFHNRELASASVNGFTVMNGFGPADANGSPEGGAIDIINASSPTLSNCVFTNDQNGAIYVDSIDRNNVSRSVVTNCLFSNDIGGGLTIDYYSNLTVTNCTFTNCYNGMFIQDSTATVTNCSFTNSQAYGMEVFASSETITNCTFTGNRSGGLYIDYSSPIVTNCILYGDNGGEITLSSNRSSTPPTFSYCDIQGGYAGTGNINTNPLFVNVGSGDLHLQPGSPCLGAGTANSAPTTDEDGTSRPIPPSIGAYEIDARKATNTTLVSSNNPSAVGQSVTFTARPIGTGATPTGFITFQFNGSAMPPVAMNNGFAIYQMPFGSASTSSVTAIYNGDTTYKPSTSSTLVQTIYSDISPVYVSPLGSDSNPGTQAAPKLTIQAGINTVHSGDTVLVADGTYTGPGNVDIDFNGKSLTVKSINGPASTIIDCQGAASSDGSGNHRGFYIHSGELNATISGFTVKNGYEPHVGDFARSGVGGGIDIYNDNGGTITVTNCTIVESTAQAGGGIATVNNDNGTIVVTNCILSGNTAQNNGGGIYNVSESGTTIIAGCNVSNNTAPLGGGFYNYNGGGTVTLTNDIVYGDANGEIAGDTVTASHCDVQGGYAGTGNINAAPRFVRVPSPSANPPDYGDLHLQPGSPCIGAGTASGAPLTDLDGATRLTPPTIGAYDRPAHTWDATAVAVGSDNLTHILWANLDGRNSAWTIDGKYMVASSAILQPGSGWTAKDVSVDAQGSNHILWVNPDGRMTVWTITKSNAITSLPIFQPGGGWAAQALSLDPQGNAHVLWYNTDGHMAVWTVTPQGGVKSTPLYQPGSGWSARSLSEDAQGNAHVLWFNTDGRMAVWTITASNSVSSTAIYQPGGNWEARKVSTDSQGNSHVLWTNTDGRMSVWTIDGSSNVRSTAILQAGTGWAAQGLAVDSAGNNRVLWDNVDGRAAVWTIPAQGSVTSTPIYQP